MRRAQPRAINVGNTTHILKSQRVLSQLVRVQIISYPSIVLNRYPLVAELASVAWSAVTGDPGLGAVVALASVPTRVGVAGASPVLAPVV